MPKPEKRRDRFTWTYALWLLPLLAEVWLYWLAPRWDWGTIGLIIWLATLIAVAGSMCFNLALRRWRRVLSLLTAPLLLLFALHLLATAGMTPDSVRFALTRQAYLAEIERSDPPDSEPRLRTFVWDDTFRAKTYSTLVYDESDEIALPQRRAIRCLATAPSKILFGKQERMRQSRSGSGRGRRRQKDRRALLYSGQQLAKRVSLSRVCGFTRSNTSEKRKTPPERGF
ncbi:hypothetical protein [Rhizobium bangladeshense]|uniref:hypothetical protein n=1 Tax=Rhizobium bangladeshense TaxID=1138189 RepID=UPI001FEE4207|nr:hypothetical protein [Rhizobium bangladeshense]